MWYILKWKINYSQFWNLVILMGWFEITRWHCCWYSSFLIYQIIKCPVFTGRILACPQCAVFFKLVKFRNSVFIPLMQSLFKIIFEISLENFIFIFYSILFVLWRYTAMYIISHIVNLYISTHNNLFICNQYSWISQVM